MIEELDHKEKPEKLSKELYKARLEECREEIGMLQRKLQKLKIPMMVFFEGWGASGKGTFMSQLLHPLDPRGLRVHTLQKEREMEQRKPYLWRYWESTPSKGRIAIFDRNWATNLVSMSFRKKRSKKNLKKLFIDSMNLETTLLDNGTRIVKIFLNISKKEQRKRFEKLLASQETRWRVCEDDLLQYKNYNDFKRKFEKVLEASNHERAPWYVVESHDKQSATIEILEIVIKEFKKAIAEKQQENKQADFSRYSELGTVQSLRNVNLSKHLAYDEYKSEVAELRTRLRSLHNEMYMRKIPMVLVFEGWDAAGKGGSIRRLTKPLDPRSYDVIPIAAPTKNELDHHYLWRFWTEVPRTGHIAIFDRSWYGRVLVERVEGFCKEEEWKRAYQEIVDYEAHMVNSGVVVNKFWVEIDSEEQLKRFKARQQDELKTWKITDEDWRNREKWNVYEQAVDEMLIRTDQKSAPWTVVEGNNKHYARVKVMRTVCESMEKALRKRM
ncbi:MAG: polyphosphate:AMP phosphotransferase [Lentisphaeria bacterium]|nr:polyphosphate:AMP phosphotransferase [Lentisphaeria bacterium]